MQLILKHLSLFLICSGFYVSAQGEDINKQWVEKDKENLIQLYEFVSRENFDYDVFLKEVPNLNLVREGKLWFKHKKIELGQYGGYISNWITIGLANDEIFYLKVLVENDYSKVLQTILKGDERLKKIKESQNWGLVTLNDSNDKTKQYYQYIYRNNRLDSIFKKRVNEFLGPMVKVEPNEKLQKSYDLLINPMTTYDYGDICYATKNIPSGRKAIEELLTAGRIDLIMNVLKGYNPEGRAYGMEALLRISKIKSTQETQIQEIIDKLSKTPIMVKTCMGSLMEWESYDSIRRKVQND